MDNVDADHDRDKRDDRAERDSRGGHHGRTAAAVALENVVDPLVSFDDDEVTYANEAAREWLELPTDVVGMPPPEALNVVWERLRPDIHETAIGTVRRADLESMKAQARIHRGRAGVTVTFHRDDLPEGTDHAVKARAVDEAPVGVAITDHSIEDNPLAYVNETFREITGYSPGEVVGKNCRFLQGPDSDPDAISQLRRAVVAEESTTVELKNYRKDGTEFWNEITIAPVFDDAGEATHFVGFQNDVTARKEAQLEVVRRQEELEYILSRIEGLIVDVTADVAGSTSRSELERQVCERIADEPAFDGAWIGERNPATDVVEIRSSSGITLDPFPVDADRPTAEALRESTAVVQEVDGSTYASFPLTYDDLEYGVLTVRLTDDWTLNDRETVILSALARVVASGINARVTSLMLATDAVVAVDVELDDPSIAPIALTEVLDGRFEYRRSVHRTDDATASLFTVTGVTSTELERAAEELDTVDLRVLVDRDQDCLVELRSEDDFIEWLSKRGIRAASIEVGEGRARATLEIPQSTSVRSAVEALEERYPGTDTISFHHYDRTGETRQEFAAKLDESLTDRQFSALQRAYLGGYFEWPRPTTGEKLAETMGVSRPTFHEHLRTAELKLCQAFFGEE